MMAGKSDVLVKLVLVFFISLLSFSIGTFVGKKYSDNQHKLAALEPEIGHRSVASEGGHGDAHGGTSGAMSDDEISKLAEEFADDGAGKTAAHGDAHGTADAHGAPAAGGHGDAHAAPAATAKNDGHGAPAVAAKTDAHGTPVAAAKAPAKIVEHAPASVPAGHGEPSAAAKNVTAGHAPAPETIASKAKQESRIPSSLPKDVAQYSVGKFTVQIAAFGFEEEAKKRAAELKTQGYSAFYVPATVNGKTWYRVNVGLFATQQEAQTYRSEFSTKTKSSGSLIQKISN